MEAAKKKILLVEDDASLAAVYRARLELEGFDIKEVHNGEDALSAAVSYRPDLILLDVMMPKISGFDVLDILRNTPDTTNVRVIMLTALSQPKDKERAEKLGADDYLVKPFAFDELLARIRVMLRRTSNNVNNVFTIADLIVDCDSQTVTRNNNAIKLSAREFTILEYMIRNKEKVLTRDKIEQHIWNYDYEGGTNVIDVYVRYLRKKIDDDYTPKLIHTIRGVGYVLKVEKVENE